MEWIEQFIEMIFPLDRRKLNIENAYLLKHTNLPKSIFKYRAINKHSLKNLLDDTVWLADPSNFNDPYDCSHTFDQNFISQSISKDYLHKFIGEKKVLKEQLGEESLSIIMSSNDPFSSFIDIMIANEPEDKRKEIKSVLNEVQNKMHEDLVKDSSKKISSSFKLCSFSERNDSMLMWSHYADYHKGFCLEYDLENIKYGDYRTRFLYPVIYSDKMFDATEHLMNGVETETFNNLYLTKAALVKASDWHYEKEWRLVFAHGIYEKEQHYQMGKPKTLFLGAKINERDQSKLVEICKSKNIPYFKMKAHTIEFKVIPTTIKDADQFFFKEKA